MRRHETYAVAFLGCLFLVSLVFGLSAWF